MATIDRRGNGRWRARVYAPDGRSRSRTFDRKSDATRWAATQEADKHRGSWVDPTLGRETFAAWAEVWRAGLQRRDSTLARYRLVLDGHLLPRFGRMALSRIARADVQRMVADDIAAGYSASEVRRHVIVLRQMLDDAIRDARIGRNVAAGVELPAEQPRPMRMLTAEQLAGLADTIGDHYRPLVLTAGWVGLRWGELAGLHLDRVDLLRRRVRVDRQLTEVDGVLAFGPPKTRAGDRAVTMPSGLVDVLAAHFATDPCQTSGMAFPTVTGRLMRRSNFRRRWSRAVAACFAGTDLDGLTFHELRHTCAALCIAAGAHPQTLRERLGHSSITVTMDTYGHMFPSADEALADALDARFREAHLSHSRPDAPAVARFRRSAP